MGCIHSNTVLEKNVDIVPSLRPSNHTQNIESRADTTGATAVTNANNQALEDGQEADDGSQITPNRKVVLDDFEIECSPEGPSDIDGLMLSVFGLENEESASLEKLSGTSWSWPGVITLHSNMDNLTFVTRFKDGEELGSVSLNNKDLQGFLAVQDDVEEERQFSTGPGGPLLKFTFTINIFEVDERAPVYGTEEIEQMVKDTVKNPGSYPDVLAQLANEGSEYLHLFGLYYTHRFEETGNIEDNNHAIEAYELAMEHTVPDDPSHAIYDHAAGTGYLTRFMIFGHTSDIERALSFLSLSVSQSKAGDVALPERLSRLGIGYRVRFKATGDLVDIENAISNQQRAVQLTKANHPDLAARLGSLGNSFKARFDRKAELADINSAIDNTEKAIGMSTERHDDMPMWLNNLGSFYQMRFDKTGDIKDSDDGIRHQQRGIDIALKGHPRMAAWLNNLGCSYQIRFGRTKKLVDIEKAIEVQTRAVELTEEGFTLKPLFLRNLGISYHARFRVTDELVDIDTAIEKHQRAIGLTPDDHADLPFRMGSLGTSFHSRFKHTGDRSDVLNAINSFRDAATRHTGRPTTRLSAAREWGLLCRLHDPPHAMESFRVAIELLSQAAGLEQTVQKRHRSLMDISDLTMTAAATAMDKGELVTAVEWLEQGRCLVWSQINQLRTPVDNLRIQDPELAERFLTVCRALEESGSRDEEAEAIDAGGTDDMPHLIATQDEVRTHVHLAKEYQTLLAKVRGISGFGDFLRPTKALDLVAKLPENCAVVTFVVHQDRCDALILRKGLSSPIHVSLSKLTPKKAAGWRDDLQSTLRSRGLLVRDVNPGGITNRSTFRLPRKGGEATISKILHELWVIVVEGIVHGLGGKIPVEESKRPRIWWCPTGPLAFLPLHAAGIYKKGLTPGFNVLDFMVSSYTPTISALFKNLDRLRARDTEGADATAPEAPKSFLLISQSDTPGLPAIPGTTEETREIQALIEAKALTGPVIRSLLLEGCDATVARVKDELKTHSWVHFTCHAIQDADSLKSGLLLHDRRLELLEIMKQRATPETMTSSGTTAATEWDLAFLSACQTATGDIKLSDEAVHIAAGMLAVGYSSVVATMWSIKDVYGKNIAVSFYKHLLKERSTEGRDGRLTKDVLSKAAWALDWAVSDIRTILGDEEEGLLVWVPYVHYGV